MNAIRLTPEYCERGFNNRAAVPDHAEYFRRWADESADLRAHVPCEIDLRYGSRPKETLDLFPGGGLRGLLIFIHGGYWRAFDKSDHSFVARPFVAAGFDVACLNYDLCPGVDIATIVDECRRAIAWLGVHAVEHQVNTERMVISGHSAGGHLTAMMYATDWRTIGLDPGVIRGGVSVSGIFDLEPLTLASMNEDLRLNAASAAAVSPVSMRPVLHAPLLLAVGSNETSEFLRQTQLLWDAWPEMRPAGEKQPMVLPGRHHFSAVECLANPDDPLFHATVKLFG